MRLVSFLSLTFIFCFCIGIGLSNGQTTNNVSPELAAARAKYDTPFIKKYRPRYEANKYRMEAMTILYYAQQECEQKCSDIDRKNIKKLADSGDMVALAILPRLYFEDRKKFKELVKRSADQGEIINASMYALLVGTSQYNVAEYYASMTAKAGNDYGYRVLAIIATGDIDKYCYRMKQGYQKFGIEFLASSIISNNISQCTKKVTSQVLSVAGSEGKLIEGYIKVKNKDFKGAYDIFSNLYSSNDNSKISANAGYCLGMMNYYGKGTQQNKPKGEKLLQESFNNGVFDSNPSRRGSFLLPDMLEVRSYRSGTCSQINE